jgi:hypothetical protein
MLSCCTTFVYGLIRDGELDSYKDGASTKITTASIRARIARQLEAAQQHERHNPTAKATEARMRKRRTAARAAAGAAAS